MAIQRVGDVCGWIWHCVKGKKRREWIGFEEFGGGKNWRKNRPVQARKLYLAQPNILLITVVLCVLLLYGVVRCSLFL